MLMHQKFRTRAGQQGSSLIEVLVAVIILSMGMLSMFWAMTKSMGFQRTAEFRNMATQFALDYSDRVRANVERQGDYQFRQPYNPRSDIGKPGRNCAEGDAVCSPAEMAAYDQNQVRQAVRASLPGGDIYAELTATHRLSIWVIWQQPHQLGQESTNAQGGNTVASSPLSSASQCPAGAGQLESTTQCQFLGVRL